MTGAALNTQASSLESREVTGTHMKVKLRLCYGGRFEQIGSHSWKFVGGEYFNESVPYGIRYADFMFKLSEKFRTAVSVKYHAPGEELVPDQLISVQDDADLQELIEDYMAHLQRPGTPCKTFRIKVFVFMASEEPLTPDEIMEGQHFFSESQLGMPARLNAVRLLDGRSSFGSTLSSVGTPSTRHQDLSTSDWPPSSAGQALVLGLDEAESAEAFNEQEILERMRTAVSRNPPPRLAAQQRRLSAFSDLPAGQEQDAAPLSPEQLAAAGMGAEGEDAGAGAAYDEQLGASMLRQISQEMEEVLQAIDRQQQQDAAAAVGAMRAIMQEGRHIGGGQLAAAAVVPEQQAAGSEEELSEYLDYDDSDINGPARAMTEQSQDQLDLPADLYTSDSADSMVRALPTHISDFGESPPRELGALLTEAALGATADAAGAQGQEGAAPAAAAAGVEEEQDTLHLPSHISAFGDDMGPLPGAMLSGNCGLDDGGFAGDIEPRLSGGQLGCARPRTQDSSFSLDGGAVDGEGQGLCAPGGIGAERAGSGDSLNSLPKLQPVHRLAKPDLKIEKRIGEGAFGEVSVAKAPLYGTVAVKWLKSDRFTKHFASFGREAALLADLNHPNVLRFYGVVTESAADSSVIGIMTEYIRGGSMSAFLRMARTLLPLRVRCELALGAANGLAYLHELRIVHFDLKPDNLLLDAPPAVVRTAAGLGVAELPRRAGSPTSPDAISSRDGMTPGSTSSSKGGALLRGSSGVGSTNTSPAGGRPGGGSNRRNSSGQGAGSGSGLMDSSELPVVKVADFGLSKHKLNSSYVSSCRDLRGTLPYMAPELVSDPERVCEKADVWSLGVVMWEMLTRKTPFQDLPPQQILLGLMCGNLHLDIPEWCEPEWRYLLEACMELNPNNRPTMRELARQLEAIRDQQLQHEQELQELQEQEVQEPVRVSQVQQQQQSKDHPQQQMVQLQACSGQQAAAAPAAPAPVMPVQQQLPSPLQQQQQPHQLQLPPLQQPQVPLLPPVLQQQPAAVVLEPCAALQQLQPGHQQLQYPPMQQQALLLQQQLCPTAQQEPVLPVLHLPAGFTELEGAGAGTYGAVCEHYWPQQSPVTPAAAAAASPGSGQVGQLQVRLQL